MLPILDRDLLVPEKPRTRATDFLPALAVLIVLPAAFTLAMVTEQSGQNPFSMAAASASVLETKVAATSSGLLEAVGEWLASRLIPADTLTYARQDRVSNGAEVSKLPPPAASASVAIRATSTPAGPRPAATTVVNNYPVVERVVQTERVVTQGGISESALADGLNQLENKLRSLIFAQGSQSSAQTAAVYNVVSQSQRIDNLANTNITNPTITGGSITASSIIGTIGNVISSALATIDDLTSTTITATNVTFTDSVTTNATSTNLYASQAAFDAATSTNFAVTGSTTLASLTVNGAATSTFSGGASFLRVNTSATSTLSGLVLDGSGLRFSVLNCSTFGNAGKLTTDSSGNVICDADQGGSGSTVGGSDTQVQFNSSGSFTGSANFTFASSTGLLIVTSASTTNATSTNLFAQTASLGSLTLASPLASVSGGTGISNPSAAGILLGSYAGGSWQQLATSSLGLLTTNVAEGSNLYFTNNRVASVIAGTTTDALAQGSINKYYSTLLFASDLAGTTTTALAEGNNKYYTDARVGSYISGSSTVPHVGGSAFGDVLYWTGSAWAVQATSTLALNTDNLTEGSNLFWTNIRFDNRLSATTTLPNLTTLANLATVGTITSGTWNGTAVDATHGGTGQSMWTKGDLLYSNNTNSLAKLGIGTVGTTGILAVSAGLPAWVATSTLGIKFTDLVGTLAVNQGGTGQSSFAQGWLSSDGTTISASTSPTVAYITATSTTATSTIGTGGFTVGGSYLVVQQGSGNVGIGTASPTNPLSIENPSNPYIEVTDNGAGGHSQYGGMIKGYSVDGSGGFLGLGITNSGSFNQAITINNFGNVAIGTTASVNTGKLTVQYADATNRGIAVKTDVTTGSNLLIFSNPNGDVGNITSSGSATAYNTSSDRRIKENIATTTAGLDVLTQIPVRDFDFINDPTHAKTQGFIAQELYQLYPYAVTTNGDNGTDPLSASSTPWGVDYGRITPLIVKAVQDIASISNTFKTNLIAWLGDASNGITDFYASFIHAHQVTADELCVGDTCVTPTQFEAMVAAANQSNSGGSTSPTSDAPSNSPQAPDIEPPTIIINGENPAYITVGDTYADLGASVTDNIDQNLGLKTFLNGTFVSNIVIATSAATTDTIDYVATDSAGNTATSTRTVIVDAPSIVPTDTPEAPADEPPTELPPAEPAATSTTQ